jgi:hypothetical protein
LEPLYIFHDIVGLLQKRPEMYLGHPTASSAQLASLIVGDCLVLNQTDIRVRKLGLWTVVSAKEDWTKLGPGSELARQELFSRLINLPEAGLEETRHEIYLTAYCTDVNFIFQESTAMIDILKGSVLPKELYQSLELEDFHLAFRISRE